MTRQEQAATAGLAAAIDHATTGEAAGAVVAVLVLTRITPLGEQESAVWRLTGDQAARLAARLRGTK